VTHLNLLFCGDFAPVRRFQDVIPDAGSAVFGDLKDEIHAADIAFLNLEAPLSKRGTPIAKDGKPGKPGLRGHPDSIHAIADAGFNVVSLANNHVMDFGEDALADTMALCKSRGMATCGAGSDLRSAQEILVTEKQGARIAIVAVAEHQFGMASAGTAGVAPLDLIDNLHQLEDAKSRADLVFISIHGGNEFFAFPRPGLKKICRFFIDRGADGVICHHSHMPGVNETYKGKPISYSLGNLVFDHEAPPAGWCEAYALRLKYSLPELRLEHYDIIPFTQKLAQGGVRCMQGDQRAAFLRRQDENRGILDDPKAYQAKWDEFCASKSAFVILRNYAPFWSSILPWLDRHTSIHKLLMPLATLNIKTNIVQCESHRELLLAVLNRERQGH